MSLNQQGKSTQQHLSNDFVPSTMVRGHNNLKESEDQLARLIGLQNDTFKELGVTTSYGKKPNASGKKDVVCSGCSREVSGRVIQALDGSWHPACFQCSQCAKAIELGSGTGSFLVRNNKAWCTKCDEWDRKEKAAKKGNAAGSGNGNGSGAGASAAGAGGAQSADTAARNAAAAQKNAEQQAAHDAIQAGKEHCAACSKAILGEAVEYNRGTVTQFFHVACFQCALCRKPVDNSAEGFNHYKGKVYHPPCYKQVLAHGACGGCGQNITTKYVQPDGPAGAKWHSACFVCSVATCKKELAGAAGYLIRDGTAYCGPCATERFSSTTTVHTSKHTGFKVDPMTHKRIATPANTFTAAPGTTTKAVTTTTTTGTGAHAHTTASKNFCTSCGTAAQAGAKFCAGCGSKL